MIRLLIWGTGLPFLLGAAEAFAYPLDGYQWTDIGRLEAYTQSQNPDVKLLPAGARHSSNEIALRLVDRPDFNLPQPDPVLTRQIEDLVGDDASQYGMAVLDITDPANPRYAEHNGSKVFNPRSMGKIIVGLAFFQALANVYGEDTKARRSILRNTMVTADGFIRPDRSKVPFWHKGDPEVTRRPLREGDTANLYTYLDWMFSASSNAAASMVQRELLLLERFRRKYPPSPARAELYFAAIRKKLDKGELKKDFVRAMRMPVTRNRLDLEKLQQASFFTQEGMRRVPGGKNYATSRELIRYLMLMEQGKLVDRFSSLELKRLLYLTTKRTLYASSPALDDAMVYFKSGQFSSCNPAEGVVCQKYRGNVSNDMNSLVVVETPGRAVPLRYMVVVMSSLPGKNSAVEHQRIATRLHRLVELAHPSPITASRNK